MRVTLISVVLDEPTRMFHAVKEIEQDDGTTGLNLHSFPVESVEWKSAEYNTDDISLILDIIIYEPFITDADVGATFIERITSTKARLNAPRINGGGKVMRMGTMTETKTAQKATLIAAGVPTVYVEAVDEDPYDVVARNAEINPEVLAIKKTYITRTKNTEDIKQNIPSVPVDRVALATRRLTKSVMEELPITEPNRSSKLPTIILDGNKRKRDNNV